MLQELLQHRHLLRMELRCDLLLALLALLALLRTGGERQHAAELRGDAADGVAQALVACQAADQAAQRFAEGTEGVAEPALRRHLALRASLLALSPLGALYVLLALLAGLQLGGDVRRHEAAEGQVRAEAELRPRDGVGNHAAVGRPQELRQIARQPALGTHLALLLLCLLLIGIGLQRQEAAADAARQLSDLVAQLRIAEQAADTAADQAAQRGAQHAAEEALWCKLSCLLSNAWLLKFGHDQLLVWMRWLKNRPYGRDVRQ